VFYAEDSFVLELEHSVYDLDTTTIDLCLSVFPWARFRSTKVAVKLHTLLDLRGNIPSFIHISDGKMHEVKMLDLLIPEAGSFYIMNPRFTDFSKLFLLHQAQAFYGTTGNAVKSKSESRLPSMYWSPSQKNLHIKASLYTILQILSLTLFKKITLNQFITNIDRHDAVPQSPNRL